MSRLFSSSPVEGHILSDRNICFSFVVKLRCTFKLLMWILCGKHWDTKYSAPLGFSPNIWCNVLVCCLVSAVALKRCGKLHQPDQAGITKESDKVDYQWEIESLWVTGHQPITLKQGGGTQIKLWPIIQRVWFRIPPSSAHRNLFGQNVLEGKSPLDTIG